MTQHSKPEPFKGFPGILRSRTGVATCLALAVVGLVLAFEHRVHLLASLPFLLPLAICLIMHFFMHRGHGGGNGS